MNGLLHVLIEYHLTFLSFWFNHLIFGLPTSGSWKIYLYYCIVEKVEGVKIEASFMSEQALLYLGSIGLLGEYSPTSRERYRLPWERFGCMHHGSLQHSAPCYCMQRPLIAENLLGILEGNNYSFVSGACHL